MESSQYSSGEEPVENQSSILSSIIDAIEKTDLERLQELMDKEPTLPRNAFMKALLYAESLGTKDCVRLLLKYDPGLLARDSFGCTTLMISALFGRYNLVCYFGNQIPSEEVITLAEEALPYASLKKHFPVVKLLFKLMLGGADIFRDPFGMELIQSTLDSTPKSMMQYVQENIIKGDKDIKEWKTQIFMKFILNIFAIFDEQDHIFYVEELMNRNFKGVANYEEFRCHCIGLDSSKAQMIYDEYKDYVVSEPNEHEICVKSF
ncbi:unnamed protein product [Hymenolepis diminuta]|uniref:ANK_REP_REGION domain-containing protein n=1 Tax=Hymenolepis diminuta TaxID=6216 RepID=A0A0R3SUZ2_HYMDI|nr:unnamed protein product [Hymenolepis diminuta]VUZ57131.1 unnamed protein product [Hymenolepis diminuta]